MLLKIPFTIACVVCLIALPLLPVRPVQAADGTWFVTTTGSGDCASWGTACSLQTALATATAGDEIWVAAGLYTPGSHRTDTFLLAVNAAVYGGFAGTESDRDARDPAANLTILSGDIDHNDSQTPVLTDPATVIGNKTNSYQVVTGAEGATLDGFTITAGYADGPYPWDSGGGFFNTATSVTLANLVFSGDISHEPGGGLFSQNGTPNLSNVIFRHNYSDNSGGGMFNAFGSPTLSNVLFEYNGSATSGGGLFNQALSNPILTDVVFDHNWAVSSSGIPTYGGGMFSFFYSHPSLTRVTFSNNSADYGGGMFISDWSNPVLNTVTFNGNEASWGGGLYTQGLSSPSLVNITFTANQADYGAAIAFGGTLLSITHATLSHNTADVEGGGIHIFEGGMRLVNSILWGNTALTGPQIVDSIGLAEVSDSVIQGGFPAGTNIISDDPLLGPLGNYGGFTQTVPLQGGSSAIDQANSIDCPAADQRGLARPQGMRCDIGAFEFEIPFMRFLPLVQRLP
jgi:hypothetical protein